MENLANSNEEIDNEFSLAIFNVSNESDDIEIKLDEDFEAYASDVGRRC